MEIFASTNVTVKVDGPDVIIVGRGKDLMRLTIAATERLILDLIDAHEEARKFGAARTKVTLEEREISKGRRR